MKRSAVEMESKATQFKPFLGTYSSKYVFLFVVSTRDR
jgi:hypothetical protein